MPFLGTFSVYKEDVENKKNNEKTKVENVLFIDNQKYAVVG